MITKGAIAILPGVPAMPVPPAELAKAFATFSAMEQVRNPVHQIIRQQAREYLAELEIRHAPGPAGRVELWARKLMAGTTQLGEAEFLGRLDAIIDACADLPGWVWNEKTLRIARQRFKFFPAAAEVFELLNDMAQREMLGVSVYRQLAAEPGMPAHLRRVSGADGG